jgi:hypothetical protein
MLIESVRLSGSSRFSSRNYPPPVDLLASNGGFDISARGEIMSRFFISMFAGSILALSSAGSAAYAQDVPSQSVTSDSVASSAITTSTNKPSIPAVDEDTLVDPASLLPDLPALPHANASLIGGTVQKVDRVQDEVIVHVFGAGKMKIFYDPRTQILRGSAVAAAPDLRPGQRIYVDTILNGGAVFARTIRIATTAAAGKSQGVVVSYRPDKSELVVRDQLSPSPVKLRLDSRTEIVQNGHAASASDLVPGTLVDVEFASLKDVRDAEHVSILAVPGSDFTFSGQVTSLDLHIGLLVLNSVSDHQTYEIYLDPSAVSVDDTLRPGADVTTVANFDGTRYTAKSLTVNSR